MARDVGWQPGYNCWGASRVHGNEISSVVPGFGFGMSSMGPPVSEAQLASPSEMIAITDTANPDTQDFRPEGPPQFGVPIPIAAPTGVDDNDGWPATNTQDPFASMVQMPPQHGRTFNVLFCDGHVAQMKVVDLVQCSKSAALWNYDHKPHPEGWGYCGGSLARSRLVSAQYRLPHPPGVVFCHPLLIESARMAATAIKLIVHAVKGERFNPPALADVKIRVFVPADDMEEKIARKSGRPGRQLSVGKGQGEFVATISTNGYRRLEQFVHRSIPRCRRLGRRAIGSSDLTRS